MSTLDKLRSALIELDEARTLELAQELVAQGDRELIEDLVATAVNQAIAEGKELHADALKGVTGGMEVPGLDDALNKFLGGSVPDASP